MISMSSSSTKHSNYLARIIEYLISFQPCLLVTITGLFCFPTERNLEKNLDNQFTEQKKILPVIFSTVTPSFAWTTFPCRNSISDHEISFDLVETCSQSAAILPTTKSKDIRRVWFAKSQSAKSNGNKSAVAGWILKELAHSFAHFVYNL